MSTTRRAGVAAALILTFAFASQASAQSPSTDPLVGSWIFNAAKSTLAAAAPRSRYRTIDAIPNGMVHVSYGTIDDKGVSSFGFWEAKLDGTPAIEYMRSTGAAPYATLKVTRPNPRTIAVVAERNGQVSSEVSFTVSEDGKILTEDMTSYTANGKVKNIRVYDKQP